jgi:hypothetical protein
MQRDTCAPSVGSRPDKQRQQHDRDREAQHRMRTDHPEIDQDDHHAKGQPIAEDGEGPRITGVTCEDQTADRTAFKKGPSGKQWPLAAMRAALAQPAPKRRADHVRAGRRHIARSTCRPPCSGVANHSNEPNQRTSRSASGVNRVPRAAPLPLLVASSDIPNTRSARRT